jgi:hypothetical protein
MRANKVSLLIPRQIPALNTSINLPTSVDAKFAFGQTSEVELLTTPIPFSVNKSPRAPKFVTFSGVWACPVDTQPDITVHAKTIGNKGRKMLLRFIICIHCGSHCRLPFNMNRSPDNSHSCQHTTYQFELPD